MASNVSSLANTLSSLDGDYTTLFTPKEGCLQYNMHSGNWSISRIKIPPAKRDEYYRMLAKALSGEKLDDISNPEGLALRINQVFHERIAYSEPTQDNQIHFKSKSKFSYLSNFHPTLLLFRGRFYPSAEHAYQSNKFSDEEHKGLYDPHLPAQKLKKAFKTKNGHPPSPEDDQARLELMQAVVKAKFACNRALKEALIQTSPYELVEATDSEFWGKGRSGEGLNHLGKILMALRSDILETSKSN